MSNKIKDNLIKILNKNENKLLLNFSGLIYENGDCLISVNGDFSCLKAGLKNLFSSLNGDEDSKKIFKEALSEFIFSDKD